MLDPVRAAAARRVFKDLNGDGFLCLDAASRHRNDERERSESDRFAHE
jgi:hypothetical protein